MVRILLSFAFCLLLLTGPAQAAGTDAGIRSPQATWKLFTSACIDHRDDLSDWAGLNPLLSKASDDKHPEKIQWMRTLFNYPTGDKILRMWSVTGTFETLVELEHRGCMVTSDLNTPPETMSAQLKALSQSMSETNGLTGQFGSSIDEKNNGLNMAVTFLKGQTRHYVLTRLYPDGMKDPHLKTMLYYVQSDSDLHF